MSTALHLAKPDDLPKLLPLCAAFHAEMGIDADDAHRENALSPLLEGAPFGAVYLMGPSRAPIGYIVLTFGWSVEFGGMDAFVDELYIRPGVRGRGMASDALTSIRNMLKKAGISAIHLEVRKDDEHTQNLYRRARFQMRDQYMLMSQTL